LLSKTYIGDVSDEDRFLEAVRDAPVKQDKGWNCVNWIESAMEMIWEDGVLENGKRDGWEELKLKALLEADADAVRREERARALL